MPRSARKPVGPFETPIEAGKRIRTSSKTIRRRIADGTITGYRIGGKRTIVVDATEVNEKLLQPIPTVERSA